MNNTIGHGKSSGLDLLINWAQRLGLHILVTAATDAVTRPARLRRLYWAAHAELDAMASSVADPVTDPYGYTAAYCGVAGKSPAWSAYLAALSGVEDGASDEGR